MKILWMILLGFLLGATGATGYLLNQEHEKEEVLLRSALSEGIEHQLDSALRGSNQAFGDFIKDFGGWDLVGDFVGRPDKSWGDANIGSAAAKKNIDYVWLYNDRFATTYAFSSDASLPLPELPIAKEDLKALGNKKLPMSFFVDSDGVALEVFAGLIEPGATGGKAAKPFGYIFAARKWSGALLGDIGKSTSTTVSVGPADWSEVPDTLSAVTFFRELSGCNGQPVLTLKATRGAQALDEFDQLKDKMTKIYLTFGLLVVLISIFLGLGVLRGGSERGVAPESEGSNLNS